MEYGNGETNQLTWKTNDNRYHNADFHVNEDNLNVNVAMLGRLVENGDTVLDIGCGEGKFGAVIAHKNCDIYGIDIDPTACVQARESGNYKKVFVCNIEQVNMEETGYRELKKAKILFDKIALIDILEHVINPTAVIENVIPFLKENGKILISVPNVNNGDIFLNLLRDHFNYQQSGVLDNTHTKYFTKRSFLEWISEINENNDFSLDCEYVGSTYGYTDFLEKIKSEKPYVYEFIQLNPYFHAIQHLYALTYSSQMGEGKTTNLKKLLNEKSIDLIAELERKLKGEGYGENIELSTLPNERTILEERVASAEAGWSKCAQELKKADKFEQKMQSDIEQLKTEIKRVSNKNSELQERMRASLEKNQQDAEEIVRKNIELEKLQKDNQQILIGWKECAEALEKTNAEWKECAEALEKANTGWKECAEALGKANAGWEECAEALEKLKLEKLNE